MNATLPNSLLLGPLALVEIFDFYDGPKLFACSNAVGQYFLGHWIKADDAGESFWLVPLSRDRLLMIRSGGLNLLTALTRPELGYLYRYLVKYRDGSVDIDTIIPEQLEKELLPDPDEFVELPTATLPTRFAGLELERKAVATQREIVGLHFTFPGTREEAPTKLIGKLLVSFQDTLDAVGQVIDGSPTMRGIIAPEILARTETKLIQAAGGSFAVEISASRTDNLFGSSLITDAVAEVVAILNIGNNVERLREKLIALKPRAASKYKVFLASLIAAETPLQLDWASPDAARNDTVTLDLATATDALRTAEQVTSELGETKTGVGLFVGVELPRRTFTAYFEGEEETYRGRISDAAMAAAHTVTLNQSYRISLRETLEVNALGEEKYKYELEAINPLSPATAIKI